MTWALAENPAFAGKEPRILEAMCHDRTPFLTVLCPCGAENHVHESQFAGAPPDAEAGMRCAGCRQVQISTVAFFVTAFAQMRAEGWLA